MRENMLGSVLRGMLIPRFLDRGWKQILNANNYTKNFTKFLFAFDKFYFDYGRLYQDQFVAESVAQYLFSELGEKASEVDIIMSKKNSLPLAKLVLNKFHLRSYGDNSVELLKVNDDIKLTESNRNRIKNKKVCFIDNIVLTNYEALQIEELINHANAKLITRLAIFNYMLVNNPAPIIALFDKGSMQKYSLRPSE